jgi:flavin-dependent dehydrogenase
MVPSADVVVLGGGPSGAVAAHLLAGWGHSVTLLTRPSPQRALAESLPPSVTRLLDHVGLRRAVDAGGFIRATGNTAWWESGDCRSELFGGGVTGYQVDRARFDRLLLGEAAAAGATVRRRATVRSVDLVPDGHGLRRVRYDEAGKSQAVRARWILDCTGRSGVTARRGRRVPEPGLRTMALVAAWDRAAGWPVPDVTHTLVESYPGGWAWSVPLSETRRHVTVMVDPTLTPLAGRGRLANAYRDELRRTTQLGALLVGARMVGRPWIRDASPYSARQVGEDGLLLAGDAASFSDPLSSFGVKKAIASGWLAAVVVRSALADPGITGAALQVHQRREQAMADALRRQAMEFSRVAAVSHPGEYWTRRANLDLVGIQDEPDIRALREDPDVLAAFAELRSRERLALRQAPGLQRAPRPAIQADRVVLQDHLIVSAFPEGIRWLRDIDLVRLSDLAPDMDQVPSLFDAYNRTGPPAPLPDFLGALAVLIGRGILEFA